MPQTNQTRSATTQSPYAYHPLLPLHKLLMSISTGQEFAMQNLLPLLRNSSRIDQKV